MTPLRVVIVGFGNIGREVLAASKQTPDIEVVGIITRGVSRVSQVVNDIPIYELIDISKCLEAVRADVAILCGGSKNDLPIQGPLLAEFINTVDSFDTHAHIWPYLDGSETVSGYHAEMDQIARNNGNVALICQGWDPGSFSLMRAYFSACMSGSKAYAFYGLSEQGGLSMGHTNAIIGAVSGVRAARQYTHARPEAVELVRSGANPELSLGDMHWRECFVVAKPDVDQEAIRQEIVNMPNYFEPFETVVNFISQEEFDRDHQSQFHDGLVIATGPAGLMEYRNVWKSNPAGTAGILLASSRAAVSLNVDGWRGAFTPLDIPLGLMLSSQKEGQGLI